MAGCGSADPVTSTSRGCGGGAAKDHKSKRAHAPEECGCNTGSVRECGCKTGSVGECTCAPEPRRPAPRGSRRARGAQARQNGRAFARDMADPERYHKLLHELGVPALSVRGLRIGEDGRSVISVERAGEPRTLRLSELTKAELDELSTTILRMRPDEIKPKRRTEDGTPAVAAAMMQFVAEGGALGPPVGANPASGAAIGLGGSAARKEPDSVKAAAPAAASGKAPESDSPGIPNRAIGACYRYRSWRRREGTEKSEPCPEEFVSQHPDYADFNYQNAGDWEVFDFTACLPDGFTYDRAVDVLEEAVGTEVQSALWALVGEDGIDEENTILRQNFAPDAVEPLWNSWSAADTSYTPLTTDAPRRSLTLRALDFILSMRAGIPSTWSGFDLHPLVLDPIAAGAMSYRIYERFFTGQSTQEDAYLEELLETVEALAELRSDLDAILLRLTASRIALLADIVAALVRLIALLGDLNTCITTGQRCEQVVADIQAARQSFANARASLTRWGGVIAETVFELIDDVVNLDNQLDELLAEREDYWDENLDYENAFMEGIFRRAQCKGLPHLRWNGGPPTTNPGADCLAECPWVDYEHDLRDVISFPFQWDGDGRLTSEDAINSNNHGFVPRGNEIEAQLGARGGEHPFSDLGWGNRVWFCVTNIDRAAMMFDWYVALATRHFAHSFRTNDPGNWLRHSLAAHTVLRMALGVVSRWAKTILHETAHNVSVFHCNEPVERELGLTGLMIGCVQDVVSNAWLVNAMAQKGLPVVEHFLDSPALDSIATTSEVTWNINYGWKVGTCNGVLSPAPSGTYDVQFQSYFIDEGIECEQSQFVDDATLQRMHAIARALAVVGALRLSPSLLGLAYVLEFVTDQIEELPEASTDLESGDMMFNIDRPLEMGGKVTDCCFLDLNPECVGRTGAPCWSVADAPAGTAWRGCCCDGNVGDWSWTDKLQEPPLVRQRIDVKIRQTSGERRNFMHEQICPKSSGESL